MLDDERRSHVHDAVTTLRQELVDALTRADGAFINGDGAGYVDAVADVTRLKAVQSEIERHRLSSAMRLVPPRVHARAVTLRERLLIARACWVAVESGDVVSDAVRVFAREWRDAQQWTLDGLDDLLLEVRRSVRAS